MKLLIVSDYPNRIFLEPKNKETPAGGVGRYKDVDDRFRLKNHLPPERFRMMKASMQQGKSLPPVKLFQIKDDFFVVDGNHRIDNRCRKGLVSNLLHPVDDLFAYISRHQWGLGRKRQYGGGLDEIIPKTWRRFEKKWPA